MDLSSSLLPHSQLARLARCCKHGLKSLFATGTAGIPGSTEACCTKPRLGCLRSGPTDEADSVRAMKGRRGLSLTSLHCRSTSRTHSRW